VYIYYSSVSSNGSLLPARLIRIEVRHDEITEKSFLSPSQSYPFRRLLMSNEGAPLERNRFIVECITLIFAGITMIGVLIYVGVTISEWKEMQRATTVSQRAWVGPAAPLVINSLTLGPPTAQVGVAVTIRNFGQSVALHVVPWVEAVFSDDKLDATMKETCDNAYTISNGIFFDQDAMSHGVYREVRPNRPFGQSLFPGQEIPSTFLGTLTPKSDSKSVLIIGCIAYKDQFGTQRRTRFCYTPPASPDALGFPAVNPKDLKFPAGTVNCNLYNDAE
jgi:hypothetical protein